VVGQHSSSLVGYTQRLRRPGVNHSAAGLQATPQRASYEGKPEVR
jgi:hypothetical protein